MKKKVPTSTSLTHAPVSKQRTKMISIYRVLQQSQLNEESDAQEDN
jgi:hypothetical protein